MSWLSSAAKSVRKAVGLPPITIGNVIKAGAVATATAVGSPAAGAAVAGLVSGVGGSTADKLKTLGSQLVHNTTITVDPLRGTFDLNTGADIPAGVQTPGALPNGVGLPVYYYLVGALVVFLLLRGVGASAK